jgi:hypothetical protein
VLYYSERSRNQTEGTGVMSNRPFVKTFAFAFCVVGLNGGPCVGTIVLSADLVGACFLIFRGLIPQSIDFTSEVSIFGLQVVIFNHEVRVFGVKTAKFTLLLVN